MLTSFDLLGLFGDTAFGARQRLNETHDGGERTHNYLPNPGLSGECRVPAKIHACGCVTWTILL